jgi:hypothetical protein
MLAGHGEHAPLYAILLLNFVRDNEHEQLLRGEGAM